MNAPHHQIMGPRRDKVENFSRSEDGEVGLGASRGWKDQLVKVLFVQVEDFLFQGFHFSSDKENLLTLHW